MHWGGCLRRRGLLFEVGVFACSAVVRLFALRRWACLDLVACAALVRLCACGGALSLIWLPARRFVCLPGALAFP